MSSTNPTNAALQVEEKGPIAQMTPAAPVAPVAPVAPIAPINNTTTTTTTAVASPPRENRSGGEDNMEADQEDKSKLQLRRSSTPPTDDMQDTGYQSSSSASEYEPPDSPEPIVKAPKFAKTNKSTAASASAHKLFSSYSSSSTAPAHTTTTTNTARATASKPHTPRPRSRAVKSGRVEKSGSASPAPTTLKCPVKGCGQTFTGRNPRQSLWHHLKYYSTRGLPDKEEFEAAHGAAHAAMKEEAEPKGTPIERNRLSSSDYRKKNPEKAKTSARLANFSARARKKGITNEKEIQEKVMQWEKEWQEKQAKEASEYFSSILLSAFE
ncbi:hypothetical protein L873DRAFT_1786701 [Choiromyces venosus 120613-1]|uniref:Uncharacterized protein n=1 Tax=Choiromyces venosus 120613-1 TaxID=1336337 RepID=A0A3N4JZ71_9PEZI|nr:hypothetical protein L873DRAFT_1786701 [Choiromyces venosus 120613-1]